MLTFSAFQARPQFPALDGLRAVSIVMVMLWHARGHEVFRWVQGEQGVTVFFVLSGFLITTLALREEARTGRLNFRAFFLRRAFRIFPMYYLTLAVYGVMLYGLGLQPDRRDLFTRELPYYLLYFQEHIFLLPEPHPPFTGAWSLGIEEKFYLLWPFLAFGVPAVFPMRAPVAAGLALACFAAPLFGVYGPLLFPYAHILVGCVLAVLLHDERTYDRLTVLARPAVLAVTAGLGALTLVALNWVAITPVFTVLVAAVTAGIVMNPDARLSGFLSSRWMVWIGGISYGLYLFHTFGQEIAERLVPERFGLPGNVVAFVLGTLGTMLVCAFLRRHFELPLIRVGRRLAARTSPAAQGTPLLP